MAVSVSGIIYRLVKGTPLTMAEGDGNFRILADAINALGTLIGVVLNPNGTLKPNAVNEPQVLKDGVVTNAKLAADAKFPPGAMVDFGGTTAPAGWLLCDGSAQLITDYPALAAALGNSFGEPTGTTFFLPDCRGRVRVCRNPSGPLAPAIGLDTYLMGSKFGEEKHILLPAELPKHDHGMPTGTGGSDPGSGSKGFIRTSVVTGNWGTGDNSGSSSGGHSNNAEFTAFGGDAGGDTAEHENRPPSIVVNVIIKT